jgi:choline dehydrogenase
VLATYVIVGAGSAGCVLAHRLSEDPAVSVLLLEAGGSDEHAVLKMPLTWLTAATAPRFGWGYESEPEANAAGRRMPIPRGKVLGGCSSINGMIYARGHSADYDDWANLGLSGWSFANVLPYFRRSERNWRGESAFHGSSGPLAVARVHDPHESGRQVLAEAARELGYTSIDDSHGTVEEGFLVPDFTIDRGRRASASAQYLSSVRRRRNLTIVTQAFVTRVLLEGTRAVGVEYEHRGARSEAHAEREVVLSAGTFNSPKLLLLSGIGPADELRRLGIEPRHDLQGVGRNLQEHPTIFALYRARTRDTFEPQLRLDRLVRSITRWTLFRTGPAASMPFGLAGFCRSAPTCDRPDIQLMATPTAMHARPWLPLLRPGVGHFISTGGLALHPKSRGSVRLASADPHARPRIHFGLLDHPSDRVTLRQCVRILRAWMNTKAASGLAGEELVPGPAVQSDEEIDAYVRENAGISHHPVGTCAMGTTPDAVVDAELRVRGLNALRVVDASVMPSIVGGNTNAPTMMIAEKASDLIRGQPAAAA